MMNQHAMSENIRAMRHKGMSEKDAVLVSMKKSKQSKKESEKLMQSSPLSDEEYPYGLRLDLDHESMEKLGMKNMPKAGDMMKMRAHCKVTRAEESTHDDGKGPKTRRSVGLQITKMKMD